MIHITLYIPTLYEHIKQIVSYSRFNSQDFPLRRFEFRVGQSFGILLLFPWIVLWSRPQRSPSSHHQFFHFIFSNACTLLDVIICEFVTQSIQNRSTTCSGNKVTLYTDIRTRKRVHLTMTYHKLIPCKFHDDLSLA